MRKLLSLLMCMCLLGTMFVGIATANPEDYRVHLVAHPHMNSTIDMGIVKKGLETYFDSGLVNDIGALRFEASMAETNDGDHVKVADAFIVRRNRRYAVQFLDTIGIATDEEYLDNVDICITTETGKHNGLALVYFNPKNMGDTFISLTIGSLGDESGLGVLAFGNDQKRFNDLMRARGNRSQKLDTSKSLSSTIGIRALTTHPEVDYIYIGDAKSWILEDTNYGDLHFTDDPALVLNVYSLDPALNSSSDGWVMGRLWSNNDGVAASFDSIDGSEVTSFVDEARVKFSCSSFAGIDKSYPVAGSSDSSALSWASLILSSINNPICTIIANAVDAYNLIDFGSITDTINTTTTFEKKFYMPDNIDTPASVSENNLYKEQYGGLSVDINYDEAIISGSKQITVTGRIDYCVYIGYYISVKSERSKSFYADFGA